jgi:hypothetical protein
MIARPLFISTFCCIDHPHDKALGIPAIRTAHVEILSDGPHVASGTRTIDFSGLVQRPPQRSSCIMEMREPAATDQNISCLSSFMNGEQ